MTSAKADTLEPTSGAARGMAAELEAWDAVETAARIRSGDVSATEVVAAALDRADAAAALGALSTTTGRAARTRAAALDVSLGDAPLAGVPTAIKDLEDVAGVVTGNGSRAFAGHVPTVTGRAVAQFLATGPVSIGKSTSPEIGLTATTEPLGRPPTRNPWDPTRSSGGSSGGAGSLVGSGVVPLAFASDGGGSIRIPASACGLVGLKPTRDRLHPLEGSDQLPIHVTTFGVVARSVRDVAAFHAAAEHVRPAPGMPAIGLPAHGPARRLRVGWVTDTPTGRPLHPEVVAGVEATAGLLEELGHDVVPMRSPFGPELARDFLLYWGMLAYGVKRVLGPRTLGRAFDPALLDPWTRGLADVFTSNLHRAPGAIRRLRQVETRFAAAIAPYDVLLHPTNGTPPPPLGHLAPDLPFDVHRDRVEAWVPYTPAQNLAGTPAISLPLARTRDGLPLGMHFAAARGADRLLLELAFELEEARPWPTVAPPRWRLTDED